MKDLYKIGVLGAGTMAPQIALFLAQSGYSVVIRNRKNTNRVLKYFESKLAIIAQKKGLDKACQKEILDKILITDDLNDLKNADLIIEAIVEDVEIKSNLFRQLDEICNEKTIFSTNTSSLSISKLASATKRQDKFVGIHFFNPVHALNLVEIVMGEKTSKETLNTAKSFINSLKKELLIIEDSPGFVINRLLLPMINEAAYILSEGKLNEHEIDKAMKLGANHPMGPLALADLIGIDLCFKILKNLSNNNTQYTPCPLFKKMIDANELGRKTGKGFYEY